MTCKFSVDDFESVHVCLYVCVLCVSLTSDFSETMDVIIIKLGTVTAPLMLVHQMLIMLTLTFIVHTDLNHENNKCFINYFRNYCQSDDLNLRSRSQVRLKFDYCSTCNISADITFKLGMTYTWRLCSCSF